VGDTRNRAGRPLAFLIVGGVNTCVGLGSFALLLKVVGLPYMVAYLCAFALATVIAFVLHRTFVFRVQGQVLLDFVRFCGVQASTFALNLVAIPALVEIAHVPQLVAPLAAIPVVLTLTYFGHLTFSFRRHEAPDLREASHE
jgi:putative flippase GtrA